MNKPGTLKKDGGKVHQSNAWIIQDDKMKSVCSLDVTNEDDASDIQEEKRNNDVSRKRATFAKYTILTIMTFVYISILLQQGLICFSK